MTDSGAISFVIPARNEAVAIARVVTECLALAASRRQRCEVVVVDDASTDSTAALVGELARTNPEVRLIQHEARQGIAQTSHDGLLAARESVLCYIDGDGQFSPSVLAALLAHLEHADFIVGWRQHRAEGGLRALGSRIYNACTRLAGVPVRDVNCGCRVLRRELVQAVAPTVASRTSFYFAELTLRAQARGYRVSEMVVPHHRRQGGAASGASLTVVAGQFIDLGRFLLAARGRQKAVRDV